jgi:hypothetical protein
MPHLNRRVFAFAFIPFYFLHDPMTTTDAWFCFVFCFLNCSRYGTKRLGEGIVSGLSGVFTQPVKGAQKEGVQGFVKGIGKGIVGVAVKPVVGVGDFLSGMGGGIQATSTAISEFTNQGHKRRRGQTTRTRTPRLIYGQQRLLKVYSEEESYVRGVILAVHMMG